MRRVTFQRTTRSSYARLPTVTWRFAILVVIVLGAVSSRAHAQDGDGLYGRFDQDVWMSVSGLAGIEPSVTSNAVSIVPEFRARYLDSAGIFLGASHNQASTRFFGGVDLRPIFLGRFLTGRVIGRSFFDLLVDSIGLDLGVSTLDVGGQTRGALLVGTGIDIPVLWSSELRLSIRLGLRYLHANTQADTPNELSLLGGLTFSFGVATHLSEREGPRTRR